MAAQNTQRSPEAGNFHTDELINSRSITVVDLFSGCGGLSLGFQRAGFKILGGVEMDTKAARSHAINFCKGTSQEVLEQHAKPLDITRTPPDRFLQDVLGKKDALNVVDVIVGGPPCQAFARIGRAKLRAVMDHPQAYLQDERAVLYIRFLEYVEFFRPLAVLVENVPDILNYGNTNIAEEIASSLDDLGYRCAYTLLNAAHYDVPQYRLRFFLLAFRSDLNLTPAFPQPTCYAEVPDGYHSGRAVAMKGLHNGQLSLSIPVNHFTETPLSNQNLPPAVTAQQAIGDLPRIFDHLQRHTGRGGGSHSFDHLVPYPMDTTISAYAKDMRSWPGFEAGKGLFDHVIRYLPRDYPIFKAMHHGDEYPQAHDIAMRHYHEELRRLQDETGQIIDPDSQEGQLLRKKIVPPYPVEKFPNKWWKICPDAPVRTLTAHIGKDTYTHIHYDSDQARVISVREAARLQSFPDGFVFTGPMNDAFRQIGNSVPPLLAYALAKQIYHQLQNVGYRPPEPDPPTSVE